MREITVISGKGGTGKTSIMASLAALAGNAVMADCDVDAADLHLVMAPEIKSREDFISGHEAVIRTDACNGCGECERLCRYDALVRHKQADGSARYSIDAAACEGCGVCVWFCPQQAIDFLDAKCGELFVSNTRCGPMVHAKLGIGAENSGKLASLVRERARQVAQKHERETVLIDGSPGIGCPVIASLTGASLALIVTEPTLSGEHDLDRVLSLANQLRVPTSVCVNKWDLNAQMTERIETLARDKGADVAGRVRYDKGVTAAQIAGRSVVENGSAAAEDIQALWKNLSAQFENAPAPGE